MLSSPLHPRAPMVACALAAALLLPLAAAPPALAAGADARAAARAQFLQAGSSRDAGTIADAAERLAALAAAAPADPVLRAYAGAATARRATTTWLPWKKLAHAEDGLAQIDQALARLLPAHEAARPGGVPAALEVRFTAASTFVALPAMFNRGERGQRLLAQVLASPAFEDSAAAFKARVWRKAGAEAAQAGRSDEARQWLQRAASAEAPQAAAAAQAASNALPTP